MPGQYELDLVKKERTSTGQVIVYDDLYNDGKNELLIFIDDFIGRSALLIEREGKILYQWNFKGKFARDFFYHCIDTDNNGRKEVVVFTYENDSIFLNAIDIESQEKLLERVYITNYQKTKGRVDFGMHEALSLDINKDTYQEIVFPVSCAFSHISRKLAAYDFRNNKLNITEKAGCFVGWHIQTCDLDGDGRYEFLGNIHSPGNSRKDYPYSDQFSWLMVCDDEMNYKFPPVKIGYCPAYLYERLFQIDEENCIAVFYNYSGIHDTPFIALYSSKGELLRKKTLESSEGFRNSVMTVIDGKGANKIALYRCNGMVEIYNEQLELVDNYEGSPFLGSTHRADLDLDGEEEFIFTGVNRNELIITRSDFTHPVSIMFDEDIRSMKYSSYLDNGEPLLHIHMHNYSYLYSYRKSFLYSFRYLVYMLVFVIAFLLFHFLGKLYQYYLKRQYEDEKRITHLQVKAIEQQMSPHFTLNILNSIGNLYENHDKQKAQYYFGKYSKLLRITLISSGEIAVPLRDELQFTQSYLELEKLRLNNNFEYHFLDNEHVPDVKVPKFLIHTFIENAVKHGIFPLQGERTGHIQVELTNENDHLLITIDDNGIGRNLAKAKSLASTGKGLSILDEILLLYKRFESKTIHYKIEDKNPGEAETGTRVSIFISNN
jgi:hypothetical protein